MDEKRIQIDGNGNITLQDISNSTITVNINDIEKISELLKTLHGELLFEFRAILENYRNALNKNLTSTPVNIVPDEYIDRNEINIIKNHFKEGNKTLMLVNGEGGIGKTTLAAKYLQTQLDYYKHYAWLFCESGIDEQIISLQYYLNLDLKNYPEDVHRTIIINKLNQLLKPCLLILDNANNADEIRRFEKYYGALEWDILITTRCNNVVDDKNELKIEHLPPEKAKELFTFYYKEENNEFDKQLDDLLESIGYNTLILQLFAKYLKERNKNRTGSYTLEELNNELQFIGIFAAKDNIKIEHKYIKEKVNTIIEKLYSLSDLNTAEEDLLFKFSLLPFEPLPYTQIEWVISPEDIDEFDDMLNALNEKGWITRNKDMEESTYKMNQVIQQFIIRNNIIDFWKRSLPVLIRIANLLEFDYTRDNPIDKFKWIKYGDFILNILDFFSEFEKYKNKHEISLLMNNLALVYQYFGEYKKAQDLLEKALKSDIQNFGNNHSYLATTQNNLALVYNNLGKHEKARNLLEIALKTYIHEFGENHLNAAIIRSNLASTFQYLGEYEKALDLFKMALNTNMQYFGKNHSDVARIQSNLATVYQALGEFEKAQNLLEGVLITDIHNFGKNHPNVARSQSNLATTYQNLGRYKQARDLLEEAQKIYIDNFSENHPSVAGSQGNLALVYKELGEYERARVLLEKALKSDIRIFGENHPNVARNQSNLAMVYQNLEQYEKARDLLERALKTDIQYFGENHPSVQISKSNLALIYKDLGKYEKARDLLEVVLKTNIQCFGDLHPNVAINQSNLALVYNVLGEREKARNLLEIALKINLQNYREDHPYVTMSQSNLAMLYNDLGEYEKARILLEKALKSDIQNYGENHPEVKIKRINLAMVYRALGEDEKEGDLYEAILKNGIQDF